MDQMELKINQKDLRDALAKKDLKFFEIALDMGADPLKPDDQLSCAYEIALSTYGCSRFVQLCLENGCSPNYLNPHISKAAINYAADSRDPRIINTLLRYPKVKVNRKLCSQSPVNVLVANANNHNVDDVIGCLTSLLEYGALISISDQSHQTPLDHLAQNRQLDDVKKREIMEKLLLYYMTDDDYTNTHLYNFLRHSIKVRSRTMSVYRARPAMDRSMPSVTCGDVNTFKEHFQCSQLSEGDKVRLLLESIEKYEDEVLDFLLDSNVDHNEEFQGKTPLLFALVYSNSYALRKLMDYDDLDFDAVECPLTIVLLTMDESCYDTYSESLKCFYLLLKCIRVDINETDSCGNTALHYALKYSRQEATRALLKMGAYIGAKNEDNIMPLNHMNAKQLQECLDDSIRANDSAWGDEQLQIQLNYDNIMAPSNDTGKGQSDHSEMATVAFIAKSKEHRYLLQHPLISSFLWLKWRQISFLFYANLLMCVIFALSLMMYTILKFGDCEPVANICWVVSWLGIVYMIVRESLQCYMSPQHYWCTFQNYVELALIILSILTCSDASFEADSRKLISVCAMLLLAVDLFLLLGYLPSMSTHMLMLEAVCSTFVKSFMLYSIFVITFGICFYTLFNDANVGLPSNSALSSDDGGVDETRGGLNKFSNPLKAVTKTIIMMTGEFDAGAVKFDTLLSYLLFLLFVFLVAIALYNLFIGLAVCDVQTIKRQAELNGALCRTKLLARNEGMLTGNSTHVNFLLGHKWLRPFCHRSLHRHTKYRHIAIRPNESNRIHIISIDDDAKDNGNRHHPSDFLKIHPEIIKMAMDVLEQKANKLRSQTSRRDIENHLNAIDNKMGEICEMLKNQ